MKKILVIEDTVEILENVQEFLEAQDFEVTVAHNGKMGLQLARQTRFDLVLCDIMMPEMDGYSVIAELRQDPASADVPFIFLTAKSDRQDLRLGMNLGADDYITKPFTAKELLEAINARLNRVAQQNTKLKQVAERVEHLENFDALTGLPNQSTLLGDAGYVNQAISKSDRNNKLVAFLVLGLDRFSRINDTLGYATGDLILQKLAQRLISFSNRGGVTGVVRLTGDEFVIILPPANQEEQVIAIAQDLLKLIAQPFEINDKLIPLTGSIGISFYPTAATVEELQRQASIALSSAKRAGGNRYNVYTRPLFGHEFSQDFQLVADFHYAWERKNLEVFYQPRIDLRTKKIVALCAVVYWRHPQKGTISLEKTWSVAEEAGLTVPLNQWILQTAFGQAKFWLQSRKLLRIAVNLTPQLFRENNLELILRSAYQEAGVNPQNLELEIPADAIANTPNINATAGKLMAWQNLGIQTTISQFGLRHTTLDYLNQLALNNLKIDLDSNIMNLQNAPILNTIIQMGHQLKLRVIVEGVEKETEAAFLRKHKCDEIQQKERLSVQQIQNPAFFRY